jgi:hypothetical protein
LACGSVRLLLVLTSSRRGVLPGSGSRALTVSRAWIGRGIQEPLAEAGGERGLGSANLLRAQQPQLADQAVVLDLPHDLASPLAVQIEIV